MLTLAALAGLAGLAAWQTGGVGRGAKCIVGTVLLVIANQPVFSRKARGISAASAGLRAHMPCGLSPAKRSALSL